MIEPTFLLPKNLFQRKPQTIIIIIINYNLYYFYYT